MIEEFDHVSQLMKEPLPDEPEALILALENIEVWNSRMQFLLAEANSVLSSANFQNLPESGTELERKTTLKCICAEFEEKRDKIEGLCEAIKTRITLGQSILRYFSVTQNPAMHMNKEKSLKTIMQGD